MSALQAENLHSASMPIMFPSCMHQLTGCVMTVDVIPDIKLADIEADLLDHQQSEFDQMKC